MPVKSTNGVRVTSHDVARAAGVSQPTVSRALRDQRGVSAATRARVRQAARDLGYVTSQTGRALSTRTSHRIGVVAAELGNPFYPALIEPLHDALEERGYRVVLVTDRGEVPVEIEPLVDGSLDGVVLATSMLDSVLPGELAARGLPFTMVNRVVPGAAGDACQVDNLACGRRAAELLVSLGHRDVAAVHGPAGTSTGSRRAEGFERRLAELGVPLPPARVRSGSFSEATGRQAFLDLADGRAGAGGPPTAVFCGNDVIALGVCNAAARLGLVLGRDLSVVGVDDIPMAAWPVFDLTTLRTDLAALAGAAAELVVTRVRSPDLPPRQVTLAPRLVERGTHGPAAGRCAAR